MFDVVAFQDELVLLLGGSGDADAFPHVHLPDELLSQKVPDLDLLSLICDVAIDGEMSVDGPHFVLVSLLSFIYC